MSFPVDDGELLDDFEDLSVGIAHCWVNDERPCSEACAAYNHERQGTEACCRILLVLDDLFDPVCQHRDILAEVLTNQIQMMKEICALMERFNA